MKNLLKPKRHPRNHLKGRVKRKKSLQLAASVFSMIASLSVAMIVNAGPIGIAVSAESARHSLRQYDTSIAISATTVLYKLKQKKRIALVDIRTAEEFARLKMPGSLNIPLHFIKAKPYLKSSPVVLVNKGYGYSKLEAECRRLNALGFKVSVLDGGLPAWHDKGGILVGDLLALREMKNMSAQEFFPESRYENILVIDVSPEQAAESINTLPQAVHLPNLMRSAASQNRLRQMIKARQSRSFQSVLVFNGTGEGYAEIKRILGKKRINVFYLQGGLRAYEQYLADLKLSCQPRESRTRTISTCKQCGETSQTQIIEAVE